MAKSLIKVNLIKVQT